SCVPFISSLYPFPLVYLFTGSPAAVLSDWPLGRPANWLEQVNEPQTESEFRALRHCVARERLGRRRLERISLPATWLGIGVAWARPAKDRRQSFARHLTCPVLVAVTFSAPETPQTGGGPAKPF